MWCIEITNNKLGWAEPHSRFPLGFPLFTKSYLQLKVVFHWRSSSLKPFSTLVWSQERLCLKFEGDPISGFWDIQLWIFWGHLPLGDVFHWRSFSSKPFLTLFRSHEFMFKIWGRSNQWLLRYSTFHILRSSSIKGCLPLKVVYIETFVDFGFVP